MNNTNKRKKYSIFMNISDDFKKMMRKDNKSMSNLDILALLVIIGLNI